MYQIRIGSQNGKRKFQKKTVRRSSDGNLEQNGVNRKISEKFQIRKIRSEIDPCRALGNVVSRVETCGLDLWKLFVFGTEVGSTVTSPSNAVSCGMRFFNIITRLIFEFIEIDENFLSSFRTKVSFDLTGWFNGSVKHQIKFHRIRKIVATVWGLPFILGHAIQFSDNVLTFQLTSAVVLCNKNYFKTGSGVKLEHLTPNIFSSRMKKFLHAFSK